MSIFIPCSAIKGRKSLFIKKNWSKCFLNYGRACWMPRKWLRVVGEIVEREISVRSGGCLATNADATTWRNFSIIEHNITLSILEILRIRYEMKYKITGCILGFCFLLFLTSKTYCLWVSFFGYYHSSKSMNSKFRCYFVFARG